MATLKLTFTDRDGNTVLVTEVVGKNYRCKKNSDYSKMYYCHKNPYGIEWVCRMNGRSPRCRDYDIIAYNPNAEKKIPSHYRVRFTTESASQKHRS